MSGIASVGASILSSAASLVQRAADSGKTGTAPPPSSQLTPSQLFDLKQSLRDSVQKAFQQGGTLDDVQQRLESSISAALRQNGVADSDRQSLLNGLSQVFQQGGTSNDVREQTHQLLTNFVNGLQGGAATPGAQSPDGVGGLLDVTV